MAEPAAGLGELAAVLLGGPARYTRAQAADRAGLSLELSSELWHALGFAAVGDDEAIFTDGDVTALANAAELVTTGLVDRDDLSTVTRMLGQSMSRLAEWQSRLLLELFARRPELLADLPELAGRLDPVLEQVQMHVWRRQLLDSVQRLLSDPSGDPRSASLAVGFADLAGYTSLSRQLPVTELAEVLERFEALVAGLLTELHGRVVKTIGDEVLFTVAEPANAAELAVRLLEQAEEAGLPPLRIGLALGEVLARYGDVYGPVVNIASRLTGLARPGSVLIDQQLAERLADDAGWSIRRLRPATVRGYSHLHAARLRRG